MGRKLVKRQKSWQTLSELYKVTVIHLIVENGRNIRLCTFRFSNTHWPGCCRLQNIQCHDCYEYRRMRNNRHCSGRESPLANMVTVMLMPNTTHRFKVHEGSDSSSNNYHKWNFWISRTDPQGDPHVNLLSRSYLRSQHRIIQYHNFQRMCGQT